MRNEITERRKVWVKHRCGHEREWVAEFSLSSELGVYRTLVEDLPGTDCPECQDDKRGE